MYNFNVMLEGFVSKKCLQKYFFSIKWAYLNKKGKLRLKRGLP